MGYIQQRYYGNKSLPQYKTENFKSFDYLSDDELEEELARLREEVNFLCGDVAELQALTFYGGSNEHL